MVDVLVKCGMLGVDLDIRHLDIGNPLLRVANLTRFVTVYVDFDVFLWERREPRGNSDK